MILVAGGQLDPNIGAVLKRILARGVAFRDLLVGPELVPRFRAALDGPLELNGEAVEPSACFVRHDVFLAERTGAPADHRAALNWFHAVRGWGLSRPSVRMLNRRSRGADNNKVENLVRARLAGLAVPTTMVGNVPNSELAAPAIMKPVAGGELTRLLDQAEGLLAHPYIQQPRLARPELRIYRIGGACFGFQVDSPDLDYREHQNVRLKERRVPRELAKALGILCGDLGLDFAAADFMRSQEGQWVFLEINSQPMFAAFDRVVSGRLTDAIIDWLIDAPAAGAPAPANPTA
jgi:hypothetical protein